MSLKVKRLAIIFVKGLLKGLALLLAVSLIAFILVNLSPIDPVNEYIRGLSTSVSPEQRLEIEEYWGLNEPPAKRYLSWLSEVSRGRLGESLIFRRPVAEIISERFLSSLALMFTSWLLAGVFGFIIGSIMGLYRDKAVDRILKRICYILTSVPTFWLGLLMLLVFSVYLKIFPIGFSSPIGVIKEDVSILDKIKHLILPAISLSLMSFAHIALHTRQKLIEVLKSDYVLFAKARGEDSFTILKRHGFRNILLPALTLQFSSFAELFGGSVMAEKVFSYPGLGSAVAAAGLKGDVPLLLGITLFSTLFVSVGNTLANLLYGIVDPKIGEGEK